MEEINKINTNTFETTANRAKIIFIRELMKLEGENHVLLGLASEHFITEYDNMMFLLKNEIEKNKKLMSNMGIEDKDGNAFSKR